MKDVAELFPDAVPMKLLVVIVNYRTPDLAVECLESIANEIATVPGTHVVVTDNASGDGSVEKVSAAIAKHHWDWATLMPLEHNGGFAYGNNRGIEPYLKNEHPPQYVYLLNPDTIVLPDALKELVKFMDDHPEVGIAGGRVLNPDSTVRNSLFKFPGIRSEFEQAIRLGLVTKMLDRHVVAKPPPDHDAQADWVSGASMIIRREVFDSVGLLDDGYFMYFEETDFCLRAHRAGWLTWYVPAAKIIHLVGQSSGVTGAKRHVKRRPRYWFESRHRYFRKNYGALKGLSTDLLWVIGFALHNILRTLRGKPRTDPPWLLCDFVRYNLQSWCRPLSMKTSPPHSSPTPAPASPPTLPKMV
jgi:N-acetylglucosaminyl-diphospho-decaprenol L-rhamnosyltransferase